MRVFQHVNKKMKTTKVINQNTKPVEFQLEKMQLLSRMAAKLSVLGVKLVKWLEKIRELKLSTYLDKVNST